MHRIRLSKLVSYYFSAMAGAQLNKLLTQTLENAFKGKQTWIISGTNISEESVNQVKDENQINPSKRRVPKFFEFWENVAVATLGWCVNEV